MSRQIGKRAINKLAIEAVARRAQEGLQPLYYASKAHIGELLDSQLAGLGAVPRVSRAEAIDIYHSSYNITALNTIVAQAVRSGSAIFGIVRGDGSVKPLQLVKNSLQYSLIGGFYPEDITEDSDPHRLIYRLVAALGHAW